ncbi:hypothetical protein [Streptomyces sp. NPDC048187]|uniref:hypothetical protein n=1 Tax=Streptomyces sp. NPDC048187 TaxID=3365509 RepID=UPI0037140191
MTSPALTLVLGGTGKTLGDGVRQVLGRPARDFTEYVAEAAATGVRAPGAAS